MTGGGGRLATIALLASALSCTGAEPDGLAPLTGAVAPAGFPAGPITGTAPADNALTEPRAQLGKRLFFERRLSRTGTVACATCHVPEQGFAQNRPLAVGVEERQGTRNAPGLANLAWGGSYFWDGRARALEDLVGQPIENPTEMDLPLGDAVALLAGDPSYERSFVEAYDGPPSEAGLRGALASFVRTLVSGNSPYDRFLEGQEEALEPQARRGFTLFFGAAGCFRCHPAGALTNDGFFNNGSDEEGGDPGRMAVTNRGGDLGKFKVPGLRNVAVTAPYMHDGSLPTLEAVIAQYARGGRGGPNTDALIAPLDLTGTQRAELEAFLRALTDQAFLSDPRLRP